MELRAGYPLFLLCVMACGGSVDNGGKGGSAGTGAQGGTGGISTGGVGTGGIGTGGIGTGGVGTGGVGTGGIGTGGIGTGGVGTGGIGTGGVAGSDYCGGFCKVTTSAGCPNEKPFPECLSNCQTDFAKISAACGPVVDELYSCLVSQAQVSCNQGGLVIKGCDTPVVDYVACTACVPLVQDDPCQACAKTACCAERSALYGAPSFAGFYACVVGCQGPSCQQNCFNKYPDIVNLASQLQSCQNAKCGC